MQVFEGAQPQNTVYRDPSKGTNKLSHVKLRGHRHTGCRIQHHCKLAVHSDEQSKEDGVYIWGYFFFPRSLLGSCHACVSTLPALHFGYIVMFRSPQRGKCFQKVLFPVLVKAPTVCLFSPSVSALAVYQFLDVTFITFLFFPTAVRSRPISASPVYSCKTYLLQIEFWSYYPLAQNLWVAAYCISNKG